MIVALIGFMASGKSSFGRAAAQRLGWEFADLDDLVMPWMSAGEALRKLGAEAFRERETEALKVALASSQDMILALGGGTPLREENRRLLKAGCRTVWLHTSMDIIWSEINNSDRPLAAGLSRDELAAMYEGRKPVYKATADYVFPVESMDYEQVAADLAAFVKKIGR